MKRESSIESRLRERCKALDILCYKFTSPAHRGVPDRILITPMGAVIFVELKSPTGVLSDLQKFERARLTKRHQHFYVVNSVERVEEVLAACLRL